MKKLTQKRGLRERQRKRYDEISISVIIINSLIKIGIYCKMFSQENETEKKKKETKSKKVREREREKKT